MILFYSLSHFYDSSVCLKLNTEKVKEDEVSSEISRIFYLRYVRIHRNCENRLDVRQQDNQDRNE